MWKFGGKGETEKYGQVLSESFHRLHSEFVVGQDEHPQRQRQPTEEENSII